MGRGRAPCCEKIGLKRGPWTPAEDMRLVAYINKYGHENWRALPKQAGLLRCGKSCRLRWINYLRPDIKRGNFTEEEEQTIIKLHELLGNRWSKIASCLPGRTDNEIKNVWNTHLKKRVVSKGSNSSISNESKDSSNSSSSSSSSSNSPSIAYCIVHDEGGPGINEEQEYQILGSESPPAVPADMVQLEDMREPSEEIIEIPPIFEPTIDLWEIADTECKNMWASSTHDMEKRLVSERPNNLSTDETKETSSPSSSACSSYKTCSINGVDGRKGPDEQTHPLFQSKSTPNDDHDMVHEEVKQEEPTKEILEIPIEPDVDFWDMLDDELRFSPCSGGALDGHEAHKKTAPTEESKGEVDYWWITYLENELELRATGGDYHQSLLEAVAEPLVPCPTDDRNIEIEVDPIKYFQTRLQSALTSTS